MWVHVAEVDSFLRAFEAFGADALTPSEADDYVRQTGFVAAQLGVIDPPTTVAELTATLESYRPELSGSGPARDASSLLLAPPAIYRLHASRLSPACRQRRLDLAELGPYPAAAASTADHRTCPDQTTGPLGHVHTALGALR